MAKKKQSQIDLDNIFVEVQKNLKKEKFESQKPLNVIRFSKEMLGMDLFPAQKIILKFFYCGTRFNEDLPGITEEEIELMKSWEIPQTWIFNGENCKLKILEENMKNPKSWFRDMVLILGRRSGKSFICSLISVYEAYKLITFPNPQEFYGIGVNPICIINTARTGDQAKSQIFSTIKRFIHICPMFDGRISKELDDTIYLLTDNDIKLNKKIKEQGGKQQDGSIILMSGNSNSPALRGNTVCCIIYDEMAHYLNTDGSAAAEEVYYALSPSVATFLPKGDGRNIVISSPDVAQGFFYQHFNDSKDLKTYMLFQLATWDANPNFERSEFEDALKKNPERAMAEFGARFRTHGGNAFFPHDKIDIAFQKHDKYKKDEGTKGHMHYLHIDPAINSDRYSFMICHPEMRYDPNIKEYVKHIVEDYSRAFSPTIIGGYIDPDEIIDNYILPLFNRFNIVSVTFDAMFSIEQQKKFKNKRINMRKISFNAHGKLECYETTRDLFITERIELCRDDEELSGELKEITVDYSKSPMKISKNSNSDKYPNDDLADCLCGCVHAIMTGAAGITKLPRTRLVRMGMR